MDFDNLQVPVRSHLCSFRLRQTSSSLARSCPLETGVSLHLKTRESQLKSIIHGRQYLRETFEFPRVTLLLDFFHSTYAVLLVMFVL